MKFHLPFRTKKAKQGKRPIVFLRLTKKVIALYAILFTIFFICLAVYVAGGGIAESTTFTLSFSTPAEGQTFTSGSVVLSGYAIGGVLKQVLVWDQRYNVGMEAGIAISTWSITIPVNQFSNGQHVMCVKGESTDGSWSAVICRTIAINTVTHVNATGYISDTFPGGLLFKPAEALGRGVIVLVSGGTAPDDQNGDNIQDVFQQSPVTPNYNPSSAPIMMSLVFVTCMVLIIIVAIGLWQYLKQREINMGSLRRNPSYWKLQEHKLTMNRNAVKQKAALRQQWANLKLQKNKINAKEAWLNREIKRRQRELGQPTLTRNVVQQKNTELKALIGEKRMFNTEKAALNVTQKAGSDIAVSRKEFTRAAAALGIQANGKELDVTKSQFERIKAVLEKKRTIGEMQRGNY